MWCAFEQLPGRWQHVMNTDCDCVPVCSTQLINHSARFVAQRIKHLRLYNAVQKCVGSDVRTNSGCTPRSARSCLCLASFDLYVHRIILFSCCCRPIQTMTSSVTKVFQLPVQTTVEPLGWESDHRKAFTINSTFFHCNTARFQFRLSPLRDP
jgi:hypothetical protein